MWYALSVEPSRQESVGSQNLKTPGASSTGATPDSPETIRDPLPLAAPSLPAGVVLRDRYRLDQRVGSGGQGDVFRATDLALDSLVAIKILPMIIARDAGPVSRLKREAIIAQTLSHPNIVRLFTFDQDPGRGDAAFLVMQFIEGRSLEAMLDAHPKGLPADEALRIAEPIASAIDYAHAQSPPVLHRDIKPGNILVQTDSRPFLTDFGIAFEVHSSMSQITGLSPRAGTPRYMSPQHVDGERPSKSDDVYSFALTVYEMIAGVAPFTHGDLYHQIRFRDPPPIEHASLAVNNVLASGLAKDPHRRPTSAGEFFGLLAEAMRTVPRPAPTSASGRRHAQPIEARAEQGDVRAQIVLAERAKKGLGGPVDLKMAVHWYRRAADAGDPVALTALADCYDLGEGVAPDQSRAYQLLVTAAELGYAPAQLRVGLRLLGGVGTSVNRVDAVRWLHKAARAGGPEAMTALARCYDNGVGVRRDRRMAAQWRAQAASAYGPGEWPEVVSDKGNPLDPEPRAVRNWLQQVFGKKPPGAPEDPRQDA